MDFHPRFFINELIFSRIVIFSADYKKKYHPPSANIGNNNKESTIRIRVYKRIVKFP